MAAGFILVRVVAEYLASQGFFVVGFDARAYLESFTSGHATLKPEDEPGDFKVLADWAAQGTSRKPILIGVSEGAGLSLLAATDPATKTAIAGVIGLGLPNTNELGWRWKDAVIYLTHGVPNEPTFSTAALADRVSPLPLAAIHSTRDEFVPLARGAACDRRGQRTQAVVDYRGLRSSLQRQHDGARAASARSHRLGHQQEPALRRWCSPGFGMRSRSSLDSRCSWRRWRCCGSSCVRCRGTRLPGTCCERRPRSSLPRSF